MPWTQEPPLPNPRQGLAAAVCDAPPPGSGSWIYAVGGGDVNGNPVATVEAYDTSTKTWSSIPSIPTGARMGLAAASIPATSSRPATLHVLGGQNASYDFVNNHDVYEPATNSWSTAQPLPAVRGGFAAVTVNGLIYALGGSDGNLLNDLQRYDPTADTWTALAPLPTVQGYASAVAGPDGNTIYAIGGAIAAGPGSVEVYNISANSWSAGPPLPSGGAACVGAADVGPNGFIYIIGGLVAVVGAGTNATANVYSYSPGGQWTLQDSLLTDSQRYFLAAATGPDGVVYAIGGVYQPPGATTGVTVADVEGYTYDPCEHIEAQLATATKQLEEEESAIGELPPAQRVAAEKALAALRGKVVALGAELKDCRAHG
jgi:hypothetical protein